MKRIVCSFLVAGCLFGCSLGFKALSTQDKVLAVADTVAYYGQYLTGVRQVLPYLSSYFPSAAPLITGALMPVIVAADSALEMYRQGRATAMDVHNAIQDVNELFGDIKGE